MGLIIPIIVTGEPTTQSPLITSFMGYPVTYEDPDSYSCITTTLVVIPEETSTICLTSTEAVTTTEQTTVNIQTTEIASTTATTIITTTTRATTEIASTTATTIITKITTATTEIASTTVTTIITTTPKISTALTTMLPTNTSIFVAPTCPNQTIGASCNISSNPCVMTQPCLNLATCYPNISVPLGYVCTCVSGFSGINCEVDQRSCRPGSSCLYGGTCNGTSNETNCICPVGKTGENCQYQVDICANITCQNDGKCVSNYGNWSCLCTNTELYSGIYCQIKSASLRTKEIASRSFGCVAIGCISAVVSFILIMDILKYFFNINPVDNEFRLRKIKKENYRKEERRRRREQERKKKSNKFKQPVIAVRFHYVHA